MSRKLACSIAVYAAAILTGYVVVDSVDNRANESAVVEPVQEQAFVCTDKYGTSQERFGVRAAIRQDQMWHVTFDDDKHGTYLQMHGEWCYVLPVEVKEEEK